MPWYSITNSNATITTLTVTLLLILGFGTHIATAAGDTHVICLETNETDIMAPTTVLDYVASYNYSIRTVDGTAAIATILIAAPFPLRDPPTCEEQDRWNVPLPFTRQTINTRRDCMPPTGTTCYRYDRIMISIVSPPNATVTSRVCYTIVTSPIAEIVRTWYYVAVGIMLSGLALFMLMLGVTGAIRRCREGRRKQVEKYDYAQLPQATA